MDEHDQLMDLCARMLTCATYITAHADAEAIASRDACSMLIEAASVIQRLAPPPDLGKPMDIIEPAKPNGNGYTDPGVQARAYLHAQQRERYGSAARPCPRCDSRAIKRVKRDAGKAMLVCPVCDTSWEWKPAFEARWV